MFQNIKVDIIYYKTNTDFELEFNLCGCCRMRLLTDKASDQKAFVHLLARGVARSRIIIVIGSLFEESGIINIVSQAIGKKLTVADNKAYGISSDDEINIISGSTPLITPEGYFGGCIIESGPQTMIMLSDNKNVRKSVMSTLIHPYVEELSALALKEKADAAKSEKDESDETKDTVSESGINAAAASIPQPPVVPVIIPDLPIELFENPENQNITDVNDINEKNNSEKIEDVLSSLQNLNNQTNEEEATTDTEALKSDNVQSVSEEPNNTCNDNDQPAELDNVELEGGMSFTTENDNKKAETTDEENVNNIFDLYLEPGKVKYSKKSYYEVDYNPSEKDNTFLSGDIGKKQGTKKSYSFNLPILIISIVLLLALAVLCYFVFYMPVKSGVTVTDYLKDTFYLTGAFKW